MPRKSQPDALSPVQHRILAAAAGHPDHRCTRPDDIKPPTYRSALQALRRRSLITGTLVEDGAGRRAAGSRLSPAGLARVAPAAAEVQAVAQPQPPAVRAPRPSTKLAVLVALLSRPDGAAINELVTTLGWLPHTTRAALTGQRKRGFTLATIRPPQSDPLPHRRPTDTTIGRDRDGRGPAGPRRVRPATGTPWRGAAAETLCG